MAKKKKRKKKKDCSSKARHDTQAQRKDERTRIERFLAHMKRVMSNGQVATNPLRYGSDDWTYRVFRQGSKLSAVFRDGRDPCSVRVAVDFRSLSGHVAFQSNMPQLLGGTLFELNGNPQAEGNRLMNLFLRFIHEGATVNEVFVELANMVRACDFIGMTMDTSPPDTDDADDVPMEIKLWDELEDRLYGW